MRVSNNLRINHSTLKSLQINLVLLQSSSDKFKFHKSIIDIFNFSFNLPKGSSEIFKDFKNSDEYS